MGRWLHNLLQTVAAIITVIFILIFPTFPSLHNPCRPSHCEYKLSLILASSTSCERMRVTNFSVYTLLRRPKVWLVTLIRRITRVCESKRPALAEHCFSLRSKAPDGSRSYFSLLMTYRQFIHQSLLHLSNNPLLSHAAAPLELIFFFTYIHHLPAGSTSTQSWLSRAGLDCISSHS